MVLRLLRRDLAEVDHAIEQRLIARHLHQLRRSIVVDPAIADVADVNLAVPDEDGRDRRRHALAGGVPLSALVDRGVAGADGLVQRLRQLRSRDFFDLSGERSGQQRRDGVTDEPDEQAAGLVAGLVAAHAVGYHDQGQVAALIEVAPAELLHQEAVLVVRANAAYRGGAADVEAA